MIVLRVLLACVIVMLGASADASASSTATGTWTLTVTFAGTGTGIVTSSPAGIVCTNVDSSGPPEGTCSAQFPDDISPWVIATPAGPYSGVGTSSKFTNISGACGPETHAGWLDNKCQAVDGEPAEVTFTLRPLPCIVKRVIGYTLAKARLYLRGAGCEVGKVTYAPSRAEKGLVISQAPKPFWRRLPGAVNLVVSKGRR